MLSEHNIILSNKCEELLQEKSTFQNKLKTDLKNSFENIYNVLAADNTEKNYYLSQEILYLYKTITEFYEDSSSPKEVEYSKNNIDINSLNNSINRNSDKRFINISQYNNNYNIRKFSNQSGHQNKFPINSTDSNSLINESNQVPKQTGKNYSSLNNSIANLKQKTPVRRPEYMDDSIRKVEDSNNIVKESNENKPLSLNQQNSKINISQNSKSNNNKLDNYINKFLNK